MLEQHGILVYVVERDIYARQAILSYLSWDRRTRVVGAASTVAKMVKDPDRDFADSCLDVVILDTGSITEKEEMADQIDTIHQHFSRARVICLAPEADAGMARAARDAGASAYLVREMVGPGIASAVHYALAHDFVITRDVFHALRSTPGGIDTELQVLPGRRQYPRLTERIEQALWLCVIEGLPAELAAGEMGVSVSTVRSYIKEGYRILEASDDTIYPFDMSPAERAFLRYTALEHPAPLPPRRAA